MATSSPHADRSRQWDPWQRSHNNVYNARNQGCKEGLGGSFHLHFFGGYPKLFPGSKEGFGWACPLPWWVAPYPAPTRCSYWTRQFSPVWGSAGALGLGVWRPRLARRLFWGLLAEVLSGRLLGARVHRLGSLGLLGVTLALGGRLPPVDVLGVPTRFSLSRMGGESAARWAARRGLVLVAIVVRRSTKGLVFPEGMSANPFFTTSGSPSSSYSEPAGSLGQQGPLGVLFLLLLQEVSGVAGVAEPPLPVTLVDRRRLPEPWLGLSSSEVPWRRGHWAC